MLPDAAMTFANHLISDEFSAGWKRLSDAQRAFERRETGGRGAGYAARLASIYAEELQRRSVFIVDALKDAHKRYGTPLGADVVQQILDTADKALQEQVEGLQGAFERHVAQFGIAGAKDCLGHQPQLQHAFVQNALRRHFWTLENVPVATETPPQSTTMNFHAPVGAVQTGTHAVANVTQTWTQENVAAAVTALSQLRALLKDDVGVEPALRSELVKDIDAATRELTADAPNTGRVARWLGGVGAVVQTLASLKPAWDIVKVAVLALGLLIGLPVEPSAVPQPQAHVLKAEPYRP